MMEKNKAKCFSLLVKGITSYTPLVEKLKEKSLLSYKIVSLFIPCEENGEWP